MAVAVKSVATLPDGGDWTDAAGKVIAFVEDSVLGGAESPARGRYLDAFRARLQNIVGESSNLPNAGDTFETATDSEERTVILMMNSKVVNWKDPMHEGGFVLHSFLSCPNEITAGLDILPAL